MSFAEGRELHRTVILRSQRVGTVRGAPENCGIKKRLLTKVGRGTAGHSLCRQADDLAQGRRAGAVRFAGDGPPEAERPQLRAELRRRHGLARVSSRPSCPLHSKLHVNRSCAHRVISRIGLPCRPCVPCAFEGSGRGKLAGLGQTVHVNGTITGKNLCGNWRFRADSGNINPKRLRRPRSGGLPTWGTGYRSAAQGRTGESSCRKLRR